MSKKRISSVRPPPAVRPLPTDARPKNRLLALLPLEDFRRILPDLETIPMIAKAVLLRRGTPIDHVFFPNGGICSVTAMMKNGQAVEIATVGDEGMVGMGAFFGSEAMSGETMVQVPDTTLVRMTIKGFDREMKRQGALYEAVRRHAQGTLALMMQSTACVALHTVEQRCCRWLLMTHDRVKSDQFSLSQEFLAMMLASARPTVSIVAAALQRAGFIRYRRAQMTILDRRGLEASSCECYATIRAEFARLGL
jgi:CRP-like cAMP-binding protein